MLDYNYVTKIARTEFRLDVNFRTRIVEAFKAKVKGENFVTPHVIGYVEISTVKGMIVELSQGESFFDGATVFGVTVMSNQGHDYDLSRSFDDERKALAYIKSLKIGCEKMEGRE